VAKTALKEGKTVEQVVVEKGYLSEEEAEEVIDPEAMTHRGILGSDED
jgi:fumarate hydratase class II